MTTNTDLHVAMPELLPCPFCGSEAAFSSVDDKESSDFGGEFVACCNIACDACSMLIFPTMTDAKPLLIEKWNLRKSPERQTGQTALARVIESDDFTAEISWLLNPCPPGTLLYEESRAAIQQAAGAVPEGLIACLRGGAQCDEDGTNIIMSREACCVAADILERIASPAPPKQQPDHLASGECGGVTQWLPIETAPKASKAILVHCADRKNTYTATWARDEEFPWSGKWKHFGGGFFDEVPTHWMPTPPAPTGQINPDSAGQVGGG